MCFILKNIDNNGLGECFMITIIGLGQGVYGALTIEAKSILEKSQTVFIRSKEDPCVGLIPAHVLVKSFDDEYNSLKGRGVYKHIADVVIDYFQKNGEVVYCVPGHPFVGETSVNMIYKLAKINSFPIHVVPGISFFDSVIQALGIDPLEGMEILSSEELVFRNSPGLNPQNGIIISMLIWPVSLQDVGKVLERIYPLDHIIYLVEQAGTSKERITDFNLGDVALFPRQPHPLSCLFVPKCVKAYTIYQLFDDMQRMSSSKQKAKSVHLNKADKDNLLSLFGRFETLEDFVKEKKSELNLQMIRNQHALGRIRWDVIEGLLGEYLVSRVSIIDINAWIENNIEQNSLNNLEKVILKKLMAP